MRQLIELTGQVGILTGDVVKSGGRPAVVDLTRSVALVVHFLRHNVTQDAGGAGLCRVAGDRKPPTGQTPQSHRSLPALFSAMRISPRQEGPDGGHRAKLLQAAHEVITSA
ncbi:hypothetical protein, partial [Nonomuraea longicatena]|uniref:hypothetical protein n=1 Tax=Nonomuraea longicatena TaxID=83682 RepID=UPI0031CFE47F